MGNAQVHFGDLDDVVNLDVIVRAVGVGDVAGAKDQGLDATRGEMRAVGPVGDADGIGGHSCGTARLGSGDSDR